jgi:hypothetical protein
MAWVGLLGWSLGRERLRSAAAPRILLVVRAVYVRRKKGRRQKRKEERAGKKESNRKIGKNQTGKF